MNRKLIKFAALGIWLAVSAILVIALYKIFNAFVSFSTGALLIWLLAYYILYWKK